MAREIKEWITVNGNHVPVYEGESKADAANRSWREKEEEKKQKQIAGNKKQADERNKSESNTIKLTNKETKVAKKALENFSWKTAVDGEQSVEISERHWGWAGMSNEKMVKVFNAYDSKHEYRLESESEKKKSYGMNITVNHHYLVRDKK